MSRFVDEEVVKERSIGTLFRGLTEDLSTLVRSEVALAKLELRETATNLGGVGALFAGALFLGLLAVALLFVTLVLALALVIPAWLATLSVAVILILLTAVLFVVGRKKIQRVQFVPTGTIESVRTDVKTIKSELSRARGNVDAE